MYHYSEVIETRTLRLCLFRRKMISEKYFSYFLMFGATENNSPQKTFSV
jgi:hypothetical protein